jgi:hypothetical protein
MQAPCSQSWESLATGNPAGSALRDRHRKTVFLSARFARAFTRSAGLRRYGPFQRPARSAVRSTELAPRGGVTSVRFRTVAPRHRRLLILSGSRDDEPDSVHDLLPDKASEHRRQAENIRTIVRRNSINDPGRQFLSMARHLEALAEEQERKVQQAASHSKPGSETKATVQARCRPTDPTSSRLSAERPHAPLLLSHSGWLCAA